MTQESLTCFQTWTVKEIKIKFSTRPVLVASAPVATTVAPTKYLATSRCRWDRPCLMVTSWQSWGRAMQVMLRLSTILDLHKEINMTCRWWHSTSATLVARVHSAQLHHPSVTTELARRVASVTKTLPTRHTCLTWWISGRHQTQTQANSNKWWWLHNFSIRVATMSCSLVQVPVLTTRIVTQYQRRLQRLNCDSRERRAAQVIQSIRATVATLALEQQNIRMPLVRLLPTSSIRLGSTTAAVTIRASNRSRATWAAAAPECTTVRSTLATSPPSARAAAMSSTIIVVIILQSAEAESKQLTTTRIPCTSQISLTLAANSLTAVALLVATQTAHSTTQVTATVAWWASTRASTLTISRRIRTRRLADSTIPRTRLARHTRTIWWMTHKRGLCRTCRTTGQKC